MILKYGLTFDDVLLIPQKLTFFSRSEIDLSTFIAPKLFLKIPLISMGMDTVTGVEMAKKISQLGGISFFPRFDKAEIQAKQIAKITRTKERVIASIGLRDDYLKRAKMCLMAGACAITLDVAHAHSVKALAAISKFKNSFPKIPIIAGTVATYEGAYDLYEAGADCVRVGVGAGTICTTRIVAGSGVPQITALEEATRAKKHFKNRYLIADGGATKSGDLVKALAIGADAVACGSLFAGTNESPGKIIKREGIFCKQYNASTSKTEKKNQIRKDHDGKESHYILHVEGVESLVRYKGPVKKVLDDLLAGIRSGLSYSGSKNIKELQKKAQFMQISASGLRESFPHDVVVIA